MLLAEDLLLLLTDDRSGKLLVPGQQADLALGGAMLVELRLSGRAAVDDRGRLQVVAAGPAGDDLLATAEQVVRSKEGKKPKGAVRPLGKGLRAALYERLAARGILRAEEGRVLGIFPTHRWPANDASHESQVREDLVRLLVSGLTPEPRTAGLTGLLHALDVTPKIVPPAEHGLTKRELRRRAKEIAEGDWAAAATRQAIDAAKAANAAALSSSS